MNNIYSIKTSQNNEQNFIIFSLNDKKYAINIQNVVEVINIPKIEIPQNTPVGISGMFNYKGLIIKTVDLSAFLGFNTSKFSINSRLIVCKVNDETFAIHTQNIETVKCLEKNNIQPMPYGDENSFVTQVYKSENNSVCIIDCNILLDVISNSSLKKSEINYAMLMPSDEKSLQILDLRAKNCVKKDYSFSFPADLDKQYILFTLDNQNYCMDIRYVKEFVSMKRLKITKLPYTPNYISGIINIKGEFLVVINLKQFLDNSNNSCTENGKLIIVEGRNFNIALYVDDIKYMKSFKEISVNQIHSSSHEYIYAEFMENEELYSILNVEEIFNDERIYIKAE